MGRLEVFSRKYGIASDDLGFTALFIAFVRLVWLPLLAVPVERIVRSSCNIYHTIGLYVLLSLSLNTVMIVVSIVQAYLSFSGTVNNDTPRKYVGKSVEIEFVLFLIDFGLQIYGVYAAFIGALVGNSAKCFDAPLLMLTLVRIVVVWNLITDSIYLLVVLVLVYSSIPKNAATNSDFNEYIGLWKRRIEWLISSPSSRKSEGQEVISQLSFLLANYFKQVDWAPSDVAVGLLLLKREQKQLVRLARLRNDSWEPRDWTPFETTVVTEYDDSVYEMQLLTRSASEKIAKTQIHKNITIAIDCQSTSGEVSGTSQSSKIQDHQEQRRFSEVSIKGIFERKMRNGLNSNHSFNTFELLPSPKAKTISEKHGYLSKDDNDFKSKKWPENSSSENRRHSISEISVSLRSELANQQQLQSILHGSKSLNFNHDMVESDKDRRISMDWRFASYSFQLQSDAKEITNIHIQDVLHFMHYANMAYVELDAEIQKKTDVLLHFSPLNDLFRAPYLVSVDHDWNAIVIAIRGTMSIADLLVDVTLAMDLLDVDLPHPEKYKVHSGMLRTAKNIVIEIMEHQVLEKLFAKNSRLSRYHIVVCGHSLGAGVGAIVAYLLRKSTRENIRCYSYSMPAIVNRNACALFEEFLVSVVAGDDIVPRMHLHSLELLREDVGRLLENCNTPKYRVFASAVKSYYRNKNITTSNPANPAGLDKVELEKIRKFALSIPKQLRIGNQAHFIHIIRGSSPPLFIPGRILYLEKLRNQESAKEDDSKINQQQSESRLKRGSRSIARFISAVKERLIIMSHKPVDFKYTYVPRWADKEEFQEIKVSRSMIRDHTIIFGIFREWQEYENCQVLKAFS